MEPRYERIDVANQELHGEVMVYQHMTITQISLGGARIETGFPLLLDSLHEFRLSLGDLSIVVKGRIVHCRVADVEQGGITYRAGVEFIEPSEHVLAAIKAFVDDIKIDRQAM